MMLMLVHGKNTPLLMQLWLVQLVQQGLLAQQDRLVQRVLMVLMVQPALQVQLVRRVQQVQLVLRVHRGQPAHAAP